MLCLLSVRCACHRALVRGDEWKLVLWTAGGGRRAADNVQRPWVGSRRRATQQIHTAVVYRDQQHRRRPVHAIAPGDGRAKHRSTGRCCRPLVLTKRSCEGASSTRRYAIKTFLVGGSIVLTDAARLHCDVGLHVTDKFGRSVTTAVDLMTNEDIVGDRQMFVFAAGSVCCRTKR